MTDRPTTQFPALHERWFLQLPIAAASGCLLFLACATFDIWPLAYIGFVPLLLSTRRTRPRGAFFWGWMTGLAANAGGFYWIANLLQRFGHIPRLPSLLLFSLLAAYQGLHFGVFLYLVRRLRGGARRKGAAPLEPELAARVHARLPMTLLAPVVMTALELMMPFIFPWYLAITQAWVLPVIQIADLTGPLGVTFLLMMVNGLVVDLIEARLERRPLPLRPLVAGVIGVALVLGYGQLRLHQVRKEWAAAPKVKVGIVQANIGIVEKHRRELAAAHLRLHQDESRKLVEQGAELIVWPESSYPYAYERSMTRDYPPGHPFRAITGITTPLLFGAISYGRGEDYPYNTAFMMEPDGKLTGRFDKNYLLVFGEYIPFYKTFPQFRKWFPAASHFAQGTEVTTFPFRDWKLGPLICYEDIIPTFGRRISELSPNLLVNITNDAWFGQTSEPYEHLALAVYRSVEHRLGMVRAVNTGVSAFIDSSGKLYEQSKSCDPVITPGVPPVGLLAPVGMLPAKRTVYAVVGDLFGGLCLAGTVVLLVLGRRLRAAVGVRPTSRAGASPGSSGSPADSSTGGGKRGSRGKRR